MIANIVDGGNTAGLMRYLVGPGKANEHTDQHLVAGDEVIMMRFGDWSQLSTAQATEIAHSIDSNMSARGLTPTGPIRNYNPETGRTEVVDQGPNHVWHCSLSLSPEEGPLSEEKWAGIARDFMDAMGFTDASGKAPCRWVAVHHGTSKNGGDHIHIAANIVREDGTKWSRWQDQVIASRALNTIEHTWGLEVIEAREHDRCARADTAQALNAAAKADKPTTDRAALESRVRIAVAAADSEVDFIRRARELGVRLRPRFASGHTDIVLGYSVALHTRPGERTQWYGGGSLARDLTLSRLRDRWPDTPTDATDAVQTWRDAWKGMPLRHRTRPYTHEEWAGHVEALDMYLAQFQAVDPTDPVALADATQDVAGLLAAASHRDGIDEATRRVFDQAARRVGRHAQLKHRAPRHNPSSPWVTLAAGLLTTATMPTNTAASQAMLLMSALRLAQALSDLYRQADQTNTARLILRDTAEAFHLVNADLPCMAAQTQFVRVSAQCAPLQSDTLPTLTESGQDTHVEPRVEIPQPVAPTPSKQADTLTPIDTAEAALVRRIRSLPGVGDPVDLRPPATRRTPVRKPPTPPNARQHKHTQ